MVEIERLLMAYENVLPLINDFIICCGYKGYVIKEYFSNYFMHMSDLTINMTDNSVKVHENNAEPWTVTLVTESKQ